MSELGSMRSERETGCTVSKVPTVRPRCLHGMACSMWLHRSHSH